MNLIKEILETEKQSEHLLQKARDKASSAVELEEEAAKNELKLFISQLKDKQTKDLEKQAEELTIEKNQMLKYITT